MRNESTIILTIVCCLYPLAVHWFIAYGAPRLWKWTVQQINAAMRVDWRNVDWKELWSQRER